MYMLRAVVGPFRVVGKIIYRVLGESLLRLGAHSHTDNFISYICCLAVPEKYFSPSEAKHERSIRWWCPWNFIFSIKSFFSVLLFVRRARDRKINHQDGFDFHFGWSRAHHKKKIRNAIRRGNEYGRLRNGNFEMSPCSIVFRCRPSHKNLTAKTG